MKHIRRTFAVLIASVTTLLAGVATLLTGVTTATAMPLPPPPASPDSPAATGAVSQSSGLAIWQLALIAAASAIVLVLATMFATLSATRARRPAVTSA